jgi:hypothetical protein
MKKRWYTVLLLGLILLLATLNIGCPSPCPQEELDAAYASAYNAGNSAGLAAGHDTGYNDGLAAGHDTGYDEGLAAGHDAGYDEGLAAGHDAGYSAGIVDGNTQGYQVGYWEAYHVFIEYLAQYEFIGDTESDFSIEIISVSTPIGTGSYANISALTLPYAWCEISVNYASGPSGADGLEANLANPSGYVSWTWWIDPGTTAGSWPIVVTASLGGIEVSDEIDIDVTL